MKWIKKDVEIEAILGTTLSFSSIERKDAGTFFCMADNGFSSSPVQKEAKIIVNCKIIKGKEIVVLMVLLQMLLI